MPYSHQAGGSRVIMRCSNKKGFVCKPCNSREVWFYQCVSSFASSVFACVAIDWNICSWHLGYDDVVTS